MEQLDLFGKDDLKPVSVWLHAWMEAERTRIKNPAHRMATMQGKPAEAGKGDVTERRAAK